MPRAQANKTFDAAWISSALAPSGVRADQTPSDLGFGSIQTDSRTLKPGDLFVALKGDTHDGHDHVLAALNAGATGILIEAGHPELRAHAVSKGAWVAEVPTHSMQSAYRALGAAWRKQFQIPMIAVAGSVGKTTTKEILATLLATRFHPVLKTEGSENGFLGIPKTLLKLRAEHRAAIVEIGIDEPGTMEHHLDLVQPTAALITAIGPEHLEKLIDLETVAREECKVYEWMLKHRPKGAWVVPTDDPYLAPYSDRAPIITTLRTPLPSNALVFSADADSIVEHSKAPSKQNVTFPLPGAHNRANVLNAWAMARAMGVDAARLAGALPNCRPAFGRTEISVLPNGATVVRDYYNANPASMKAALQLLAETKGKRRFVALGDMLELGPQEETLHRALADDIRQLGISGVWLLGEKMRWLKDELSSYTGKIEHFADAGQLAKSLEQALVSGDVLLIKGSRGMRMERIWDALAHTTTQPHTK